MSDALLIKDGAATAVFIGTPDAANAAAQVGLAAAQVALATTQAGNAAASATAATTNGAAQVTLATTQAAIATSAATNLQPGLNTEAQVVVLDTAGNSFPIGTSAGYDDSFSLQDCETIVHFGDSITEGTSFCLKDKAWLPIVSNFSPYRHINLGLSGDTTAKIIERIVDNRETIVAGTSWYIPILGNTSHSAKNARFAFLMSWANETPTLWRQNAPKIMELFKSLGAQPVIMNEEWETPGLPSAATYEWDQSLMTANVARRYDADLVDTRYLGDELKTVNTSPFKTNAHPGTRLGAMYWAPVIEWLKQAPRPRKSIKLYRTRATASIAAVSDLVFDTIDVMLQKFTEISIGHRHLATANQDWFEELSSHTFGGTTTVIEKDQYANLATGLELTLTDYALFRIAVPGTARSLEGIGLELYTDATEVYLLDKFAANTSSTDTPMGAWVAANAKVGRVIPIRRDQLSRTMRGNELFVLLHKTGGVTVAHPVVHYSGKTAVEPRVTRTHEAIGAQLAAKQDCASLTGWTITGSPTVVVPFDLPYGAPRAPGLTSAITGVIEITSANKIRQGIALAATNKDFVTHRFRVWARYWPKPYLDNTLAGFGFPAGQVLDRSAGAVFTDSAIKYDSFDFKTLRCSRSLNASGAGAVDAYQYEDRLVGLYWTPIDFFVTTPKAANDALATLNLELSCTDGTLQIGKVAIREVNEYVDRN